MRWLWESDLDDSAEAEACREAAASNGLIFVKRVVSFSNPNTAYINLVTL